MFEILFQNQPALFIPVVSILGVTLVFTTWVIAHYWARIRQLDLEASLKQDMLNRGLAPADIERVLYASSRPEEAPAQPDVVSDNEYYLVEKMLDEGHSVEEIERLVRAFKEGTTAIRPARKPVEV